MDGDVAISPDRGQGWNWRTVTLVVMAVLGVGVLVALIVTLGLANSERDRALARRNHSFEVMILARTLTGTIARSEASLGRYVISGDRSLGQLYYDEWRLATSQLDRLDQITEDDQQPTIDRLRRAFTERGSELALTALNTNYGKNSQALARYYQARQAPALAEINHSLTHIIESEREVLDQRTSAARTTIDQSAAAAKVLSIFGILLLVGAITLGWLTTKAMTESAAARAEADSERERAEELALAVARATEELRRQETRLRQVQKMEAVGQLTGGIAHDFNNMLAVVMGGLELAQRNILHGAAKEEVGRHVDSAMEGATRAAALTRQLLAFARETALNPEIMDIPALLHGMSELFERTLGDAISVVAKDDCLGWRIRADRVQLENSLLNLAVNARDAMGGRGTLTITAGTTTLGDGEHDCPAGDYLTLAVTDTGCGMLPEVAERVFEPFYTTKPVGQGTGLGLSQIFAFVRQQHGAVTLATELGVGTTVTLLLPRDRSHATPAALPSAHVSRSLTATDRLCIMVVEDDPRVLAATIGALEELGHDAFGCDDPLIAPAVLAGHGGVDLIVSDVLMPNRTGPEMIAALGPDFAHVAVLFVTGYAGEFAESGVFAGHQVLRKPFTLNALDRAIASATTVEQPTIHSELAA